MKVDEALVRKIAHLARIRVDDEDIENLEGELTSILSFVEQLSEVNTDDIGPMTSSVDMVMRLRADEITDGGYADDIIKNAPAREEHYFVVPKVVE